jgi:alanyl-tRNA synthetase
VITFDANYSRELCGGTHVQATGEIGYFVIVSESSVAAGVRRIEAYTGDQAVIYARQHIDAVQEAKRMLKAKELKKAVEQLITEKQNLSKEIERLKAEKVSTIKKTLLEKKQEVDGVNYIVAKVELPDENTLKQLAFELRNQVENLALVLGAVVGSKALLAIMLSDSLVKDKGWHAANIVKEAAKEINGGGGGQPFFATAGGSKKEGLEQAIQKAKDLLK